jgi:MFS family permease
LGAPLGFLLSSGTFLLLTNLLTDQQFLSFGWRIPFIASALLVFVGLYVRLKIAETPDFVNVIEKNERVRVPFADVFVKHTKAIILGTFVSVTNFLLFYLMTVFTLSWGTSALHYSKAGFQVAQMISAVAFGIGIPISSVLADRYGRANMLIVSTACIFLFGLVFSPLFSTGSWTITVGFLVLGMFLMGLTYGPLGTALAGIFPAAVRYTGASLAFTLAGILGASLTPALATKLATLYGLNYVGYYLSFAATITFFALIAARSSMKE